MWLYPRSMFVAAAISLPMVVAGAQMTLLPLILADPDGLAMSATQMGQVYMGTFLLSWCIVLCAVLAFFASSCSSYFKHYSCSFFSSVNNLDFLIGVRVLSFPCIFFSSADVVVNSLGDRSTSASLFVVLVVLGN